MLADIETHWNFALLVREIMLARTFRCSASISDLRYLNCRLVASCRYQVSQLLERNNVEYTTHQLFPSMALRLASRAIPGLQFLTIRRVFQNRDDIITLLKKRNDCHFRTPANMHSKRDPPARHQQASQRDIQG